MSPRRLLGLAGLAAVACGASLPLVPRGPAPPEDRRPPPLKVDDPPPVALIEQTVVGHPDAGCAWMDGYHEWRGSRWDWVAGGWVRPPPGCFRSDPVLGWSGAGPSAALLYWPPRWYPDDVLDRAPGQQASCRDPVPCPAP